jgi:hypothetical protein
MHVRKIGGAHSTASSMALIPHSFLIACLA